VLDRASADHRRIEGIAAALEGEIIAAEREPVRLETLCDSM
jgi:hypothetical protein